MLHIVPEATFFADFINTVISIAQQFFCMFDSLVADIIGQLDADFSLEDLADIVRPHKQNIPGKRVDG